jgi:hypothetical protein
MHPCGSFQRGRKPESRGFGPHEFVGLSGQESCTEKGPSGYILDSLVYVGSGTLQEGLLEVGVAHTDACTNASIGGASASGPTESWCC